MLALLLFFAALLLSLGFAESEFFVSWSEEQDTLHSLLLKFPSAAAFSFLLLRNVASIARISDKCEDAAVRFVQEKRNSISLPSRPALAHSAAHPLLPYPRKSLVNQFLSVIVSCVCSSQYP